MSIICLGMIFSSSSFLAASPLRRDLGLFGSSSRWAMTLTIVFRLAAVVARPDCAETVSAKWKSHRAERGRQRDSGTERRRDRETEGRSVVMISLHLLII